MYAHSVPSGFTNTGAALICLLHKQQFIADDAKDNMRSLRHFYDSQIYREINLSLHHQHQIRLLPHSSVSGAPPQELFVTKLYVVNYGFNGKYQIQFPVFLHLADLHRLDALNLHKAFPDQQLWVQYLHFPAHLRPSPQYQICQNFTKTRWFDVIKLSEFNVIIKNRGGNGYVTRHRVESVVLNEMTKNAGFLFTVHLMANHVSTRNTRLSLIVSMEITHKNKRSHFNAILNEMNRHLTNNFNDKNSVQFPFTTFSLSLSLSPR